MTCHATTCTGWRPRPLTLPLPGRDEVHLWRAHLSRLEDRDWRASLAASELERADRFHVIDDRRRYTVTRALLRTILGEYLDLAPRSLCFMYNSFGKPSLGFTLNNRGITFNVAHSGDYSLLLFGMTTDVGVDIEHLQIERNIVELAEAVLPPSQYREVLAQPEAGRKRAFLQAWTRREAIGKALGVGLSIPRAEFDRAIADGSGWSIGSVDLPGDYVAAFAARAPGAHVRLWDWKS
jgi:4'-phosphopantetheinyl transferase